MPSNSPGDFPMENHAGSCYFHAKFLLWVRLLSKTITWMGVSKMSSQQELPSPKSQHCISQLFWAWCGAGFTPATPEPVSQSSVGFIHFGTEKPLIKLLPPPRDPRFWLCCSPSTDLFFCFSNPPWRWWLHPVHSEGQHLWI